MLHRLINGVAGSPFPRKLAAPMMAMGLLASCSLFKKEPTPEPAAAPDSEAKPEYRITSSAGESQTPQTVTVPAAPDAASATPTPSTPTPTPPREGFFTRMWQKIFPRKEHPPAATAPTWVGTIKIVNERDGYVLIDSQPYYALVPGTVLHSVGNDFETGVVRVSKDRNPPFFIADVVSGKPQIGNRVYSPQP